MFHWTPNYFILPCATVSAAAVHAGLRGSLPPGCPNRPLPSAEPGHPLHLFLACLHHPSFPEPCDLWFSGRAVQEVLAPVRVLSESQDRWGQDSTTDREPTGEITISDNLENSTPPECMGSKPTSALLSNDVLIELLSTCICLC